LTRQTPWRNVLAILDYKNFERIDEPIQNPACTPKTPRTSTRATQAEKDDTIDISDDSEDDEVEEGLSNEEIEVDAAKTPTRRNLQSTVIVRKHHLKRRVRKAREETTWVQAYFDVVLMDETWINEVRKSKPVLQNRRWTCGPAFSSLARGAAQAKA
jgi:hypothetical protein